MINSTNETSYTSKTESLTEIDSKKKISTISPREWFEKIGRTCLSKVPMMVSFLAIGIGCMTQKNPILKTLGGGLILSVLIASFSKVMQPKISREEKLKTNIKQLIEKFPDFETMENKPSSVKNEVENLIQGVMKELPKGVNNQKNIDIMTTQCLDVLKWTLQCSKDDQETDERKVRKNDAGVKLFNMLNNFHNNMNEVFTRIENDKDEIKEKFFSNKDLGSPEIELTGGETHNKGKCPCFVIFKGHGKIVYKPRDIRVDALITGNQSGSLFKLINSMDKDIDLHTYQFLPKEKYGYVEFLSNDDTDKTMNLSDMKKYYYILGQIQAIATVFGIHDLNEQNVLVHKKKPCLIDLEVAFNLVELIKHNGETGLRDAIINCGGYTSKNTHNTVIFENDEKKKMNHNDNLVSNYEKVYKSEIISGFKKIKSVFSDKKNQEVLKKFVDSLPNDLTMRFVPIRTTDLIPWSVGKLINDSEVFVKMLNFEQKKKISEYDNKNEITSEQTKQDIINADVPYIEYKFNGDVSYNGVNYLKSKHDLNDLIKKSISNSEYLDETEFLASITIKKN